MEYGPGMGPVNSPSTLTGISGISLALIGKQSNCRRAAEQRDELATADHVWMAPAWQMGLV
jgi:hypothetical protein